MDITRRRLLGYATAAAATAVVGQGIGVFGIGSALAGPDTSTPGEWHPLTRSLLERAFEIDGSRDAPDKAMVERTIRQFADGWVWTKPLVIKWMDSPTDAFDHLSRLGLDALLDMGSASFWRRAQPPVSHNVATFDRAFEVRMMANELLGVHEHDRILMAPKLRAKCLARSANRSDGEVFHVRAVSSQIGWLETSLANAATEAVSNVELLLRGGVSVDSTAIDNQLKIFESHERGLLATWETWDSLICVPRSRSEDCDPETAVSSS
jgi:hypothetical protein